ncbi:MAG: lipopolysaccharide biosynthesis protein [Flavobacteriales bacterium]
MSLNRKEIITSGALKVCGAVLTVVVSIVISRFYSAEDFAGYVLYTRVLSFAVPLVTLGIGDVLIKHRAAVTLEPLGERMILFGLFLFSGIASVIYLLAWNSGGDDDAYYMFSLPGLFVLEYFGFIFISRKRFTRSFLVNRIIRLVLFLCSLVGVAWFSISEISVGKAFFYTTLISMIIVGISSFRILEKSTHFSRDNAQMSLVLWLSNIIALFANNYPIFLLGLLGLKGDIATLGPALEIAAMFNFFVVLANTYVKPRMAELYSVSALPSLSGLVMRTSGMLLLIIAPGVVVTFCFGHSLLELWGGYHSTPIWVLWVLVVAQVVNGVTGPAGVFLNMSGRESISLAINTLTVVVLMGTLHWGLDRFEALDLVVWSIFLTSVMRNCLRYTVMHFTLKSV